MSEKISNGPEDLIFDLDRKAADFIWKRYSGAITVDMDFEPMLGSGCKCSAAREVTGCYIPRICAGAPGNDKNVYCHVQTANVEIFYSPRLRSKLKSNRLRLRIKRFLFFQWLELEDAGSIVCAS